MTTAAATKETKTIRAEVKQAGEDGSFEAVIATLGVVDHDGDIIEPGAFAGATVAIVPAHDWGSVPLGKARIEERGDKVIAVGKFNLDVAAAKDWHAALKFDLSNPPAIQEWSFGYYVNESSEDTVEGERIRRLVELDSVEVSPVLRGAGIGTGTLMAKRRFADQIDEALRQVEDIATRAADIRKLREEEGRKMSKDRTAQLEALLEKMTEVAAATKALAEAVEGAPPDGDKGAAGDAEEQAKAEDAAAEALAAWAAHEAGIKART